jgi:hypothetical protein
MVNLTLQQAMKTQKGSRGVTVLFLGPQSSTPQPFYFRDREPVPIVQEVGWTTEPVRIGAENLPQSGFDPRTVQSVP